MNADLVLGNADNRSILERWLRFDPARVPEVEAAYDAFIRGSRPGVHVSVGIAASIVLCILVGVIFSNVNNHAYLPAVVVTFEIVFYGSIALSVLFTPREIRRVLLGGCVDVARASVLAAAAALAIAVVELAAILLLQRAHVPFPGPKADILAGGWIPAFFFVNIAAPVCEEFLVQGWFQTRVRRLGVPGSVALSTLFFVLIHLPTNLYAFVRSGNLLFNAYLRGTTRSLGAAIVAHATNNLFFFAIFAVYAVLHHGKVG